MTSQTPPEIRGGVGRDERGEESREKNRDPESRRETFSTSDSSDETDDNDGPDEILVPEPGMGVWKYQPDTITRNLYLFRSKTLQNVEGFCNSR